MHLSQMYASYFSRLAYSAELTAVLAKATTEGYTKPAANVLSVYDEYLYTPLKAASSLTFANFKSLQVYGVGSIEFNSLNLIDPDTHQHTFPANPTYSQPPNEADHTEPFGIKSNGTGYVNTNFHVNEYAGIETSLTIGGNVSESSTAFATQSLFGARGQAGTSNTSLILRPLATAVVGNRQGYGVVDNFNNANHKALYTMTMNATQCITYKSGTKDIQTVTPTAPDISNNIFFLARNGNTAGGSTPTEFYTQYANLFYAYQGTWSDAMELEFRTIIDTFFTQLVDAFFFSMSSSSNILVFDMGQSNSQGHAETNRLFLTDYSDLEPINVEIYHKTDRTSADNGYWDQLRLGVNNNLYGASTNNTGCEFALGPMLRDRLSKKVYFMKCANDGTSLHTDWDEATPGSLYQVATEYYFDAGLPKLHAALPADDTVKVVLLWHQGEEDAADPVHLDYKTNLESFFTAFRAADPLFATAPLFLFSITDTNAFRLSINAQLSEYADENANTYYIDINDQPTKAELTAEQAGGVVPTSADDSHFSYLAQLAKAERVYAKLVEIGYI